MFIYNSLSNNNYLIIIIEENLSNISAISPDNPTYWI
jgi:hypothetical protein